MFQSPQHRPVPGRAGQQLQLHVVFGNILLQPGGHTRNHRIRVSRVGECQRDLFRRRVFRLNLAQFLRVYLKPLVSAPGQYAVVHQVADDPPDRVAAGGVIFGQPLFRRQKGFAAKTSAGQIGQHHVRDPAAFAVIFHSGIS